MPQAAPTALHIHTGLHYPSFNLIHLLIHFFGYEIRLKITAVLNMEPIINLAVNKRKFCPDESLTLALSAEYQSLSSQNFLLLVIHPDE